MVSNPKLFPSHSSPLSIAPLPQDCFGMQLLVSSLQFVHFKIPAANPKSVQSFKFPKSVPSHCSPMLIVPSLHVPPENPEQLAVLILHWLSHLNVPDEKSLLYCEHCPLNGNELVSHCSVFVSTTPLLHVAFGLHPSVL